MTFGRTKKILVRLISIAILSAGFAPVSWAGTIDTSYMIESDAQEANLDRVQVLLAQKSVADQLQKLGVDQASVDERLQGMTSAELVALEGQINESIAGSGAIGVIGTVFLVLLILELVGVTDIFKGF